jgi:hypothetical protein
VVPDTPLLKLSAAWVAPLQSVCPGGTTTLGLGNTRMPKFWDVPTQPLAVGVTVIVAVTEEVPLLAAIKDAILPAPVAASPMDMVLFVQL